MAQAQLMTLEEEAAIALKAFELKDQGKLEEYERVRKQIPLQPYLVKFVKEHLGAAFLINLGWNLSEVVAEYGSDWLSR
jgi:hypothetical protein